MKILNTTEQVSFDKPPTFNSEERKRFFNTPSELMDAALRLRAPCHQIGFLLASGYFKATKKFFPFEDYHLRDIEYLAKRINISAECFHASDIPETTKRRHRDSILTHYGFRGFEQEAELWV